ncbi:MAG: hypothetical protein E6Q97_33050 [Desulfurellales bacterium]|nr:MAG: hypothetical protein E6Q97_33050 [Desulfurellales bacterium]
MTQDRGREFYVQLKQEGRFPPLLSGNEVMSLMVLIGMSYLRDFSDRELADFFNEAAQQTALANQLTREKDYVPGL